MSGVPEMANCNVSNEEDIPFSKAASSNQGYVFPEGKVMPNRVFVGGIDGKTAECEIKDFFARYGAVKEVKLIMDRNGISKGYGFVSFQDEVDVQKIVESQICFRGKRLKLGPAIRKQQNLCTSHVQHRSFIFNPPAPQLQYVCSSTPGTECIPASAAFNPVTHYFQAYPYQSPQTVVLQQVPLSFQHPQFSTQVLPQWLAGEQRNWMLSPINSMSCDPVFSFTGMLQCSDMNSGPEPTQPDSTVEESMASSSGSSPQKKLVDRGVQTNMSCLLVPDTRHRHSLFMPQDEFLKDRRVHQSRRSRALLKTV
ncbi:deleted in azoospermia-like [Protopterus annectens]|uniref:deleted in azoospermia-like n=1 Tax=Protopterus annectens TaxID=7888 RepID=UPI001CFB1A39|nr:deleted in azoospermia-like [Protopterus annectens]